MFNDCLRKIWVVLLSIPLVLSLCACGSQSKNTDNLDNNHTTKIENDKEDKIEEEKNTQNTDINTEKWTLENVISEKESTRGTNWVKLPYHAKTKGPGKIIGFNDGDKKIQIILISENSEDNLNCSLENCFKEYLDDVSKTRSSNDGGAYQNGVFEITSSKKVNIKDYEMYVYEGVHNFDWNYNEEEHLTENFVAYGTKSKQNDAFIGWVVLDQSEEQEDLEIIQKYAEIIAKSLEENIY